MDKHVRPPPPNIQERQPASLSPSDQHCREETDEGDEGRDEEGEEGGVEVTPRREKSPFDVIGRVQSYLAATRRKSTSIGASPGDQLVSPIVVMDRLAVIGRKKIANLSPATQKLWRSGSDGAGSNRIRLRDDFHKNLKKIVLFYKF